MKKTLFIVLGLIVSAIIIIRTYNRAEAYKIQKEIGSNIIRLHVRANSDSKEDQNLKFMVRDYVIEQLDSKLEAAKTLDEARNILYHCKDEIKQNSQDFIRNKGYDYGVSVYFSNEYFPMKTYGDMVFPAGKYEAFRIDIGKSEGKNWWCVLFPPLCFVDSTYAVVPDDTKAKFRNVLSDNAYDAITLRKSGNYAVRFRYLTFLNKFIE